MSGRGIAAAWCCLLTATVIAFTQQPNEKLNDPAARQYAFAERLLADGEEAFALLEFKRFVFDHPDHPRAAEAAMAMSHLYLSYLGDVGAAKRTMTRLAERDPDSNYAKAAQRFIQFIEINSDFQGKPLSLLFSARGAESRGEHAAAAAKYQRVVSEYPKSQVVDDALYALGKLQLQSLDQPAAARASFTQLIESHPKSPYYSEAHYLRAAAIDKSDASADQVAAAYKQVIEKFPDTDAASRAAEGLAALEKRRYGIKRQFDKQYVAEFKLVKEGYLDRKYKDYYQIFIEMSADLSEHQIKATLEDALIKHYDNRTQPTHPVRVSGYFEYPLSEAGYAIWTADNGARYKVNERKTEDVVRDLLFDLIR